LVRLVLPLAIGAFAQTAGVAPAQGKATVRAAPTPQNAPPDSPPKELREEDAYASPLANPCSWAFGTASVEKTVTFAGGRFALAGFKSKLDTPEKQFVQRGAVSSEFRFSWDGQDLSGASGGWACSSGHAESVRVGGQSALQLTVVLTRAAVSASRFYIVFPHESLIREWSSFKNIGASPHEIRDPSFFDDGVFSEDLRRGRVRLVNMGGAYCCGTQGADGSKDIGPFTLREASLSERYSRTFDSYDEPGCVVDGSKEVACKLTPWQESSSSYLPWFAMIDDASGSGVAAGFDYFGHWQFRVSGRSGDSSIEGSIPNFSRQLAAGESVTTPVAFAMVFRKDLDDMGNRLLDWQYRYLWDYTRPGYFAGVAAPGNWCAGTQWCENWDPQGIRQKIFSAAARYREIGFDVHWTDNGWWKAAGDWTDGPDFRQTADYLKKSGINSIIYYPIYGANQNSDIYRLHPGWFPERVKGYTDFEGDLSIPEFEDWMGKTLIDNAVRWGDYEFRADSWPLTRAGGAIQLAQDQAFRRVLTRFLDARPASAFYAVDSGGNELSYDYVRFASHVQYTDTPNARWAANAAFLFPVDKLNPDPNAYSMIGYCAHEMWETLANNPAFYSSEQGDGHGRGDTTDPAQIECARRLVDTYHYMVAKGIAGRWVRQYHPVDSARREKSGLYDWFERVSAGGTLAMLHRVGPNAPGRVTVFPRGLNPDLSYTLGFQFDEKRSEKHSGAELMSRGIEFPQGVGRGDIVYFNMQGRPGAGTDRTAPMPPGAVAVHAATNVNYPGIEITWQPGSDDNWVSLYRIYRDGKPIGRSSKGLYYFDHGPAAATNSTYSVTTVDGDGNASQPASSGPRAGIQTVTVDDAAFDRSGFAQITEPNSFEGTLSLSRYPLHSMWHEFTGSAVELFVKMGPDGGCAKVDIDGREDARINTYAPDDFVVQIPIFSKAWAAVGKHTIAVEATYGCGKLRSIPADARNVYVDALRITTSAPSVTPAEGEWSAGDARSTAGARNADGSADFSFTFNGSAVRIVADLCGDCGEADVYVDGSAEGRIDLYGNRGNQARNAIVYQRSFDVAGKHVVKLVPSGAKNIDSSGFKLPVREFHVY
jgi:hypothetical protein